MTRHLHDRPRPAPAAAPGDSREARLPRRFYAEASVEERDRGFALLLDGRPARTPAKRPLAVPTRALGSALAAEWDAQGERIDPATMPVTRIVNVALDGVADRRAEVIDDLVRYAGSDLTCYRAGEPESLVAAQAEAFDRVLAYAADRLGARFVLSEGVMPVAQPEAALAAVRRRAEAIASPFALAALHVMTTLAGSVLIPLAYADGALDAEAAWDAAHVDERFQESQWGEDESALQRRAARRADFMAAAEVYEAAGG